MDVECTKILMFQNYTIVKDISSEVLTALLEGGPGRATKDVLG